MRAILDWNKALWVLSLLTIVTVSLAACGGGEEEEEAAPVATEAPEAMAPTPTVVAPIEAAPAPTEAPMAMAEYNEAPMLAQMVSAGSLPPVGERLPTNPLVVPVEEEIGQYGGTLRRAFTGPVDRANMMRFSYDAMVRFSQPGTEIIPNITPSWDITENGKVYTFALREGMKWSDGMPYTADNIIYWYNNYALNDDLAPTGIQRMKDGQGNMGSIEKVDDYTVRFSFGERNMIFLENLAQMDLFGAPYQPDHYLMQFHVDHASKADLDKLLSDSGFEAWHQLYKAKGDITKNPDLPVVTAWLPETTMSDQQYRLTRNPYYFKVDPDGNQLPYVDTVVMGFAENVDVLNLRAVSGEIDFQARHINMLNYPVLVENADKSDFRVYIWPNNGGSDAALTFNQSYEEDPAIAELLTDKTFRQALSLALDREEINESIFLALGEPRQNVPPPNYAIYPGDECAFKYAMHDLEKANMMLDSIGLDKKNSDGFRLYPDSSPSAGDVVTIEVSAVPAFGPWPDVAEMTGIHWGRAGIKVDVSIQERSLAQERHAANQHNVFVWNRPVQNPFSDSAYSAPTTQNNTFGPLHAQWYVSGGESGVEPPEDIKMLLSLHDQGKSAEPAQQIEIAHEIFEMICENLWFIGTIGQSPLSMGTVVVNNDVRNVPEKPGNVWTIRTPGNSKPEQFFFKQ